MVCPPLQFNKLFTKPLPKNERFAVIFSANLGDSLIAMVMVNNLVRNGYMIDVFNNCLYELRAWFPWANIFPGVNAATASKNLAPYFAVLHMYGVHLISTGKTWHHNYIALSDSIFYKAPVSMLDIQVAICRHELGLTDIVRTNSIKPLSGLVAHKYNQRIIIHPTSSLARKNWPKPKFIKLARSLMQRGYNVAFVVAANERSGWLDVTKYGIALPEFASLSQTAAFIYETGFFIGNDSGIGHLASNLGVPTVSIVLRKSVARQWRPSWALGEVVLSPAWLNPRQLKEKFWRQCISVKRVLNKFDLLLRNLAMSQATTGGGVINGKINGREFICRSQYFTAALQAFFSSPDWYLANAACAFYKNDAGDTTTIALVEIGDKKFVVKRYNIKSAWHFLRKFWRPSNAMKSWRNVSLLQATGVLTVNTVAVLEQRFFGMRGKAYFITEYVSGIRGNDYFAAQAQVTRDWPEVMENIVSMMNKLQAANIVHNDFQYGNLLIVDKQPLLLDLDHMKIYKSKTQRYWRDWQRDVAHFLHFIAANPAAYRMLREKIRERLTGRISSAF